MRDNLLRDLEIEVKGNRQQNLHPSHTWQVEDRVMKLESISSSVFDVLRVASQKELVPMVVDVPDGVKRTLLGIPEDIRRETIEQWLNQQRRS